MQTYTARVRSYLSLYHIFSFVSDEIWRKISNYNTDKLNSKKKTKKKKLNQPPNTLIASDQPFLKTKIFQSAHGDNKQNASNDLNRYFANLLDVFINFNTLM